ncbi:MAG: DUF4251 domain-containing protein [Chitinophagaceae bacterium]
MSKAIIFSLVAVLAIVNISSAQSIYPEENRRILAEKNFIFIAQQVSPQRGAIRQLGSQYDLAVNPDSVTSFLPYFGRAYAAPFDPTDGGIKFTSVKFRYELAIAKNRRYEIVITPKDARGVESLRLIAYDNGRATLLVNQRDKDPITFHGYLIPGRER